MSYPFQLKSFEEYKEKYKQSIENPEQFWDEVASHFFWKEKYTSVLNWNFETAKTTWFKNGKLNITENCLDKWAKEKPNETAIIWESNFVEEACRTFTYKELLEKVNQFCHVLKNNGAKKGDRICIYMPMIPELSIAVLACARIGAIHSVVFAGFSSQSIADRINDAKCNIVITADGSFRGNKIISLKKNIDEALLNCTSVNKVIVYKRTDERIEMISPRDIWWHEEIEKVNHENYLFYDAEIMDAEDELFILYTSGSTGTPKGVVHSCAGYMVYTTYTFVNVFQYNPGDIYFCTADAGWITGHSYLIYGPLSAGATTLMFEGIPTFPDAGRFWDIIEKYNVNIFYTAPTAIRSLMSFGDAFLENKKLSSLKVLGTVGEPINEEAWQWYFKNIGKENCPIVDTWWQTETGGIMISNLAGITPHKPSFATLPLPGIQLKLMNENGVEIEGGNSTIEYLPSETISGNLCISFPWPSIIRTTFGNHERFKQTYFSTYKNNYFTGDGCLRDKEGNYRITGRVDDVLNVSGHRIGTAELENVLNKNEHIIESAVVGFPHDIKGQAIMAFVICDNTIFEKQEIEKEIMEMVSNQIGSFSKPDKIIFVSGLPKTRSGKIMRRILRKIAEGEKENFGDISTLLEPNIVAEILSLV
jgi:acetyl-CoA synthetase